MSRQLSLFEAAKKPHRRFSDSLKVDVVELWSGIGGFSSGARSAGHRVRLSIDPLMDRAQIHARNFPGCVHVTSDLPCDDILSHLPPPSTQWHMHANPPVSYLSQANGGNVREKEEKLARTEKGLESVIWYLDLVEQAKPATWTMEGVNHPEMLRELDARGITYVVAHMERWGLPQCRVRVIAGSMHLIRRFEGLEEPQVRISVKNVMKLPVPGARIKGSCATYSAKSKPGSNESRVVPLIKRSRCCNKPSLTVIGVGHTLVWCNSEGEKVRQLSPKENATLQSFPDGFIFHHRKKDANISIGEAFPPMIACKIMSHYKLPRTVWTRDPPRATFPAQPWYNPESDEE